LISLPPDPPTPAYGIEEAMRLMRTLPVDQNAELVVRVIKSTLESMKVRLVDIIADATHKQETVRNRIATLRDEISGFEKQIETRRKEIGSLEMELAETTKVKERLEHADGVASTASGSTRSPSSRRDVPPPPPSVMKAAAGQAASQAAPPPTPKNKSVPPPSAPGATVPGSVPPPPYEEPGNSSS